MIKDCSKSILRCIDSTIQITNELFSVKENGKIIQNTPTTGGYLVPITSYLPFTNNLDAMKGLNDYLKNKFDLIVDVIQERYFDNDNKYYRCRVFGLLKGVDNDNK